MMSSPFFPLSQLDAPLYASLYRAMPQKTADTTLSNLQAWAEPYGLEWCLLHGLCWIRQTRSPDGHDATPRLWAPTGDWTCAPWARMPELTQGLTLHRTPAQLAALLGTLLPHRVETILTPGQWEYVYTEEALTTLTGPKLRKKRAHARKYAQEYGMDMRPLSPALLPAALELEADWMAQRLSSTTQPAAVYAESHAARHLLTHLPSLPQLTGHALFAGEIMTAFCISEAMDDTMLVVHSEKARAAYQGVYQAINLALAQHAAEHGYTLINREQDGNDPGLRQAKQSYAPAAMIQKDTVHIAPA